jgi:hypothetical protein
LGILFLDREAAAQFLSVKDITSPYLFLAESLLDSMPVALVTQSILSSISESSSEKSSISKGLPSPLRQSVPSREPAKEGDWISYLAFFFKPLLPYSSYSSMRHLPPLYLL